MSKATRCAVLLTNLLEYSCRTEFSEQMEIARELFVIATGKVNDEDPFYETRMSFFQQYFVFDYRLSNIFSGSTIFELFLMRAQKDLPLNEIHEYEQFRSIHRSLFRIDKYSNEAVYVIDLLSKTKDIVYPLPDYYFAGFDVGRVFDARILSFYGVNFFTGTFIFHPDEVQVLIEKHVKEFLTKRTSFAASKTLKWREELQRRHTILSTVAEQKRVLDNNEKKKSIEILTVNKNLNQVASDLDYGSLVMALGNIEEVSPFIPETPFYDTAFLLDSLDYCELKSIRYKHISPDKLYIFNNRDLSLSLPPRSIKSTPPQEKAI